MDTERRNEEWFEGEGMPQFAKLQYFRRRLTTCAFIDVRTLPLRRHLEEPLERLNLDGSLNRTANRGSHISNNIPSMSASSSQMSVSEDGRSSSARFRFREQSSTPMTANEDVDDTTSSVNATHGTATAQDPDEKSFIWGLEPHDHKDLSAERYKPGPNNGQDEHAGSCSITSSLVSITNNLLVPNSNKHSTITTATRIALLILLTAISFVNFAIAIHTIHLARHQTTTLKEAKFSLLLTTHIVAVCAALGAVVLRRTPTEALLYFVVIILLGNMVRRETECLL
jgi:hypothetical protein